MAVEVIMPQMGESIFEGTVTKWLKKPGDHIERDEPLFEISTDKVDAEIPSPAAGVLREIKVHEGQTVPVQTVVALIDEAGAGATAAGKTPAEAAPAPAASMPASPTGPARPAEPQGRGRRVRSSPLARRLAREHGVDLSRVQGSGAGGRVSKQDILAAAQGGVGTAAGASAAAPAHAAAEPAIPRERIYFGTYEVQPLSIMRQRIAEHMTLSKRIAPHVYSIEEADLTRIVKLRAGTEAEFETRHGVKLTFMPFFVRACGNALREFPVVNASLDGQNLVLHKEINIGIAVALEDGLIVPVVTNADERNFWGLQRAITDLAERARAKKLKPEEVQHSTFTVTNPGIFGGLMGLPIISQPNVAILAIGAIQKRPVAVNDAVAVRSMVYLTMSYDHRAVDGALGNRFLARVRKDLENWKEEIL